MKEKSKIYQNRQNKEFHNNKLIYTSYNQTNNIDEIRSKINKIINDSSFIYSKVVHLVIGDKTIVKRIVGIYDDSLVTIDNEYISLNTIKDIYI